MNSILSNYLRGAPSDSSLSQTLNNLQKVLDTGCLGRLSPSLLEAFLIGDSGVLHYIMSHKTFDATRVMTLLNSLMEREILSQSSLSTGVLIKLLSLLFTVMKSNRQLEFWKAACDFVLSMDSSIMLITESLLDSWCGALISLYSSGESTTSSLIVLSRELYCNALRRSLSVFNTEPCVHNLRCTVRLSSFGFILLKLHQAEPLEILCQIQSTLHQIATHPQLEQLRAVDGRIQLKNVFKVPLPKLLGLFHPLLPEAPCQILSISESLIQLFPEMTTDSQTFGQILKVLMQAVRLPAVDIHSSSVERKDNQSTLILNPAVYTLNLLVRLLDIWQRIDISPEQYAVNVCQLFDLLRVFPMSIEHAEVRLCSWWHFLCCIPRELLNDGFRRFVSPFLANLLGRYLSLSAPMGDPDLHRYKLSVGNAYDGNAKALELTEHVFSSFFKSAGLNLKQLDNVPCLDMDASTLCSNSYQLLVAVVHWLRLICSHTDTQSFSLQTEPPPPRFSLYSVDVIWLKCCRAVLESSADAPSNGQEHLSLAVRSPSVVNNTPQPVSRMAIQYVVTCTCHLLTPTPLICDPESKELYRPVLPSSVACLNILEEVFNLTRECTAPEQDKMDLLTDLLLKSNELGNLWMTEMAETPKDAQPESVWTQWSDVTIRLLSCNSRLNVFEATSGSSFSESWNLDAEFLPLFRRLLTSLLPDSVRLATSCDQVSQNSSLDSLFSSASSLVYCPAALRFWNELADRLTHFITTEHVICEGDPMITADLSTVYAMLLFPFWFVGPTPSLESNFRARGQESTRFELPHRNEVALVERMDKLFTAFHQEASLLTTLASNAWIGQLGSCLVALVSAIPSEPAKKFNFNFLGRFLRSLAENAEHVEERAPTNAAFDPFSWCGTPEKSFGQLTGLLLALQTCLLHSPWFDAPAPVNHSMPSANISTGRSERDVIKSPSSFLSRVLDCSDESSYITVNSDSNSNTSQSILVGQFTPSHKLSYGLIDALEAVTILIRHHARGPEALVAVIDALNAPLERLTACCARTAADIHRTEVELDEPLLIIQRREQAKIALEEIYICLWRGLDISPITIPQSGLVDVVRTLSHGSVHSGAKVSFSLTSHHCLGLLRASLNLCNAHSTAIDSRSSHAWCFFLWFVGFWNRLVDTCLTDRTSARGHWDEVRTILAKHEQDVKARLSLLQAKQSTSPVQTSIGGLRQKRTPISSRSRQSGQSDRLSTSFDDNASSARMLNQEFYNQNSRVSRPSRGRPRGGRLSLKRVPSVDIQTTPLRRRVSQERVTSLTQSAPSSLTGSRRSRGRPRASSPTAHKVSAGSPARDVASVQGIDVKGSSEFWSPLCGSPVLLPGRPLVKRRLFPEDANQVSPCRKSVGFSGLRKRILPVTEDTQQLRACDRGVLSPPAPVDFDDSAQFVVISSVPTNMHKRRRTLTAHQKEHFEEQKQGYLPTTYTELDLSQQSISDSQSQSQTQQHIPSSVASVSEKPNDIHFPVSTTTTQQTAVESMASAEDAVSDTQNSSPPNELDILSETSSTTAEIVQTTTETEATPIIHQMDASSIEQHATTSLETESITDPSEQNCGAPLTTDTASPVPPVVATPVCSVGQLPDFIDSPPRVSAAFASRHSRSPTPPSVFVSVPLSLSPLMRGGPASRAQRMLVLGLQKAAEQTARQKSINSMESAPPGASTPDQKQLYEDRIATPPQNHTVVETDSPSGIMRGFYSRKKSQRVSFADHPVVYTFGPSPNSSRESSGSGSPVGRCSSSDTATEGSPPTLNKESDSHPPLSADSGAPSSPSSSLPEAPAGLQPLQSCIEPSQPLLDKSQISPERSSPRSESTPPQSPDHITSESHRHRRKLVSPQRRLISPRTNHQSRRIKQKTARPEVTSHGSSLRKDQSPISPPDTVCSRDNAVTLIDTIHPILNGSPTRSPVPDSEPMETNSIYEKAVSVLSSSREMALLPSKQTEDYECLFIESSQATQDSLIKDAAEPTLSEKADASEMEERVWSGPTAALVTDKQPNSPLCESGYLTSTENHGPHGTSSALTCDQQTMYPDPEESVEAVIRCSLHHIATKLPDLSPSRHQIVLMEALSTFKAIMD